MTVSYALLPIPLDMASAAASPTRFRVEILTTPEFLAGQWSPQQIDDALSTHPLFSSSSPQILHALAIRYDAWRAAPQQLVAGGAGVVPVTLRYAGETAFETLLANLRAYLRRPNTVRVAAIQHDDTHDRRTRSDFLDVVAAHKRVVEIKKVLKKEISRTAALEPFSTPRDLSDLVVAYARRRWLNSQAQATLVHLLMNEADPIRLGPHLNLASVVVELKRNLADLKKRLDPATTSPLQGGAARVISRGSDGNVSADDPNVAIHAALTEGLVARACGLVTSWTAESVAPLAGDYVLTLDPMRITSGATIVCRKTAVRRNEATHPLLYADLGRTTTNGGLALLTDQAGHPRYSCTSVNAETALVQATLLQAGNSISNDGSSPALLSSNKQRDDRPPEVLSSEQYGANEMEAIGLTFSAPVQDLVVPDSLKSPTREADLPCLFLDDLWIGYKVDLAPAGQPLRSIHRQMRRVTFSSGNTLLDETEDFAVREPANQMDTAISTEVLRYIGMSAAQAVDYAHFLGTFKPPAVTPGAPFVATAESGINVTPIYFSQSYDYRLRTVLQGGVSLRHDDPGLPVSQSDYVRTARFDRGRSFRAGEVIGQLGGGSKNDSKEMSIFLTAQTPQVKVLIAPTPVDPDTARFNGQFLSGANEPTRDMHRAFVSDLPGYLTSKGIDAAYYCDPEVSEISVELWLRNGDPEALDRSFVYREGAYCEIVDPVHFGPATARFGPSTDWRRFRPIEIVFESTSDLKPKLRVHRDGRRVEILVPLFAEIDVVLTPVLSAARLASALEASVEGLTSDWPVVEHRIRVVYCGPGPATRPMILSEVGAVGPKSAFIPLLRRERLSAPAQLVGRIDVDAASTGSLQIEGAWQEIDDDPIHPHFLLQAGRCVSRPRSLTFSDYLAPPPAETVAALMGGGATVLSQAVQNIGRHCAENKLFLGGASPSQDAGPIAAACVLPLPDARRRRISCVAVGHGRYASHFLNTSAKPVETRSEAAAGDVPASMLLSAPQISHILPIVREIKTRNKDRYEERRIYGFRIYVRRPWFLSGLGERLAIGCHAGPVTPGPRSTLNKLFTQWGEDPIQRPKLDATLGLPRAADFRSSISDQSITLDPMLYPPDSPEGSDPVLYFDDVVRDPDALASEDARLALASLALRWDEGQKLWYSDVELARPFSGWMGLALYRHQPHAHEGLQLSRSANWVYSIVIQGEQVSWVRQGKGLHVTIGPVFDKTLSFEAAPDRFQDGVSGLVGSGPLERSPFATFDVDGRKYFEGHFAMPPEGLRIVRRRFGFDLSSFRVES